MKTILSKKYLVEFIIFFILLLILISGNTYAADYASFDSFYKEGLSLKSWIIGGVLAVVGVAAVFFTAGAAAPFTATIGSAIGGMMGLSGAAATSAGLALLGGGSLAAGGLGVVGGTALLTAIFEVSVLGGSQYAQAILHDKNYSELCEQVKDYPNFPPIQNGSGPKVISIVKDELGEKYDLKQLPSSPVNISAVNSAITDVIRWQPPKEKFYSINYESNVRREKLRVYSLRAILEFMNNNYNSAYSWAESAKRQHQIGDGLYTVPDYIISVAGFFTGKVNAYQSQYLFSDVIKQESESPILPLLFSIYISRVGAMDKVDVSFLECIMKASWLIKNKEISNVVKAQVMTAMLAKLWENQEIINFYVPNIDSLDYNDISSAAEKKVSEYKDILALSKRCLNDLNTDTSDGRDFYVKSSDAFYKYEKNLKILEDSLQIIKNKSEKSIEKK